MTEKNVIQDTGIKEELSFAVANMITTEEHFLDTAMKTKNKDYLVLANEIRKLRAKYLKKLVSNFEGQSWCSAKHLLGTYMHLQETAIKCTNGEEKLGMELLKDSGEVYQLFLYLQEMGKNGTNGQPKKKIERQ